MTLMLPLGLITFLKIEYSPPNGDKTFSLTWSSDSNPDGEILESICSFGDHLTGKGPVYANIMLQARNGGGSVNANGDYTGDAIVVIQESLDFGLSTDPLARGKHTVRYTGNAVPTVNGNCHPLDDYTYDSGTDITTAHFTTFDNNVGATFLNLTGGSGVTRILEIMKPNAPGSSTSYPSGMKLDPVVRLFSASVSYSGSSSNFLGN